MSNTELMVEPGSDPDQISIEGLEIANTYLANGSNMEATANALSLDIQTVKKQLNKREVKDYIDQIFFESGYRNRDTLFGVMDTLIATKLEEMNESETTSSADILEIMKTYHKMRMDEMSLQIKRDSAAKTGNTIGKQTNVQINASDGYTKLIKDLMG